MREPGRLDAHGRHHQASDALGGSEDRSVQFNRRFFRHTGTTSVGCGDPKDLVDTPPGRLAYSRVLT